MRILTLRGLLSPLTKAKRGAAAVVAIITTVTLLPLASAQEIDSDTTVIAVSDSDGSTSDIDQIVDDAEGKGAEVVEVTPDGTTSEGSSDGESSSEGGLDDLDHDPDASVSDQAKAGVDIMEPLVEEALGSVEEGRSIAVVASGNGAGAAGNILVKVAAGEGPVEQDRVQVIALIGDPYRTGSTSKQSEARATGRPVVEQTSNTDETTDGADSSETESEDGLDDLSDDEVAAALDGMDEEDDGGEDSGSEGGDEYDDGVFFSSGVSDGSDSVGFESSEGGSATDLPDKEESSDADREVEDALADDEDGPDRVGENNNGGSDSDDDREDSGSSDGGFGDQQLGENEDGQQLAPRWGGETYAEKPEDNAGGPPETKEHTPYYERDDEEDTEDGDSGSEEPSESPDGESDGSSEGSDSDRDSEIDDNYAEDDFDPGNGSDGQDVQDSREANPEANRGEGSMGDGDIWANENGGARGDSDRGLTSSDDSDLVTTSGTGVLGAREGDFGEMSDRTLSVCSSEDERCASNGMATILVDVLTGDLQRAPELGVSALRGIAALGRLIASVDKKEVAELSKSSTQCGVSVATVSGAVGTGYASVSTGVLAPAAVPALMSAATAAGGAAQSCGATVESGMTLAADLYEQYTSDPDLVQAGEIISILDPDSATGKKLLSRLPVEFQSKQVLDLLRHMARVGYALDSIAYDDYMRQYAAGGSQMKDMNPMAAVSMTSTTLGLVDALVKAMFNRDQTVFGAFGESLSGLSGSSSMASLSSASDGQRSDSGSGSESGDVEVSSQYADRYDYNSMSVADGLSAVQFVSDFTTGAL